MSQAPRLARPTVAEPEYLAGLNPKQRLAVLHTAGPLLVVAGAGSGKTSVVTRRIARLIAEGQATPSEILAVTFTNKAANEMRDRVANLIGERQASGATLSTFHSFCLGVLRQHIEALGYRKNFTISGEGEMQTLVRRVLGDLDGIHESFSPSLFREHISLLKGGSHTLDSLTPDKAEDATQKKYRTWLPEVYERYESALRAANSLDFDDLLRLTVQLLSEKAEVLYHYQTRFQFVMVDEYQDTNPVQLALVKALVEPHHNICVVGDDDQSIYGWRGADVRNILTFEKQFPDATIITLDQNYRSTEVILSAANGVISNNRNRRSKKMWCQNGPGREIDWITCEDDDHEAKTVVERIHHVRQKTGAQDSDFAVLYRSNTQSRPLEMALRQAGIPYVVYGGQEFYDRAEVRDIVCYLKVLANPRDEPAFLRVVNMPRRGIGDATLHAIHDICREQKLSFGNAMAEGLKSGKLHGPAADGVREFLGLMSHFRQQMRGGGLARHTRELVRRIGYREELERTSKSPEQAALRWENVDAVIRSLEQYETSAPAPTLTGFLDESSLNTDTDRRSKNNRRDNAVSLMTIHSAKGLEFPFVFIVGVEEGLIPHGKSLRDDALEEERRLFYVALTRAKRHVTLFEALRRAKHGKERDTATSRFLKEIPPQLIKRRGLAVDR